MASVMSARPVCVVVVNWNGWQDTITCLRSLFTVIGHPLHVVVCDNGSTDGSAEKLFARLGEEYAAAGPRTAEDALGNRIDIFDFGDGCGCVRAVHLLRLKENAGYAGAINRGICWGRETFSARSFWLLNNDVRAESDALRSLVRARDAVPDCGLCGSVLLDWDPPSAIQAIGGVYNKALGVGRHLRDLPGNQSPLEEVFLSVDYPVGASLFVEQDYLDRVGLMDESYFLYYEEMDWVERGRRHGYRPVISLRSRLFHKQGVSTGSHGGVRHLSMLSERCSVINRLRITRKFWPWYLPVVWLSLFAVALERLFHGERERALLVVRLMGSPHLWLATPKSTADSSCPKP